jgi:hypothetical protein
MPTRSGTVSQGALSHQASDYGHQHIGFPVLGIVLNVYPSDHEFNRSANVSHDGRGSQIEARVLVLNDGNDSPWILSNVAILPMGCSGFDNFSEEVPKGVSGSVDDAELKTTLQDISKSKLDGDFCVVSFIGGSINQPFMERWWPHPSNTRDNLVKTQGRRSVRRFQGTRVAITSNGNVVLDTSEANQPLKNGVRAAVVDGGDVRLTVKESRQLELNWNPSVYGDPSEPDFLWSPNADAHPRETKSTKISVTKDLLSVSAGENIQLTAQRADVSLTANQKIVHTAPDVRLGGVDAVEALPHFTSYSVAEQTFLTALSTFAAAIGVVVAADPSILPPAKGTFAAALSTFLTAAGLFHPGVYKSTVSKTK